MGSKKVKGYVPEALEHFGKRLKDVRPILERGGDIPDIRINAKGLQNAVEMLPKKDKECIIKFFGLTGGINHSKKIMGSGVADVAYTNMRIAAVTSMRKLFQLDYMSMYDDNLCKLLETVTSRVAKSEDTQLSDIQIVKYLLAFFSIGLNGPKMSFEEDPTSIDTECDGNAILDEYAMLKGICQELGKYPNNSINLSLLINFFELMDFKDMLAIKKSLNIDTSAVRHPKEVGPILDFNQILKEVEVLQTLTQIRTFKERIFAYGPWDVTSELILGNSVELEMFMKELNNLSRDWSKLEKFKTGQKNLRTLNEFRTLDVYNIGGLEFTDTYEVMFLYMQRNLIAP